MEIIEERYNQLGYSRAAFSTLLRDLASAKKDKSESDITRITNTIKNLSSLFIPLAGNIEKEFYRSYIRAFKGKVKKGMENKYALTEVETFCFPCVEFGIQFKFIQGFDFLNGHFIGATAFVFEHLDSHVLYYRALNQPQRRIIKHFLKRGLKPLIFGSLFTGSISELHLAEDGTDQLEKYLES